MSSRYRGKSSRRVLDDGGSDPSILITWPEKAVTIGREHVRIKMVKIYLKLCQRQEKIQIISNKTSSKCFKVCNSARACNTGSLTPTFRLRKSLSRPTWSQAISKPYCGHNLLLYCSHVISFNYKPWWPGEFFHNPLPLKLFLSKISQESLQAWSWWHEQSLRHQHWLVEPLLTRKAGFEQVKDRNRSQYI